VAESPCTGDPGSTASEARPGGIARPGEAALKAENAAVEMYRLAALLLGDEVEAMNLIENTVAAVDIDPCADPCAAKGLVRERVLDGALALMHRHDPAAFDRPPAADPAGSCLEDEATLPLSGREVADLMANAARGPLRDWFSRLTQAQRAVFVQRALLGSSNADTARAINRHARPSAWTPESVSTLFRQALCSLASSLVHAAPALQA